MLLHCFFIAGQGLIESTLGVLIELNLFTPDLVYVVLSIAVIDCMIALFTAYRCTYIP